MTLFRILLVGSLMINLSACKLISDEGSSSSNGPGTDPGPQGTPETSYTVNPQEPSTPDTPTPDPVVAEPVSDEIGSLIINNDDAMTKNASVQLQIFFFEPRGMKISQNSDCSGGVWEDYATSKTLALTSTNQVAKVSVRFLDWDRTETDCYSDSILHDDKGPEVLISKYPLSIVSEGEAAELIYEVGDAGGSGVSKVSCTINGVTNACPEGRNSLTTAPLLSGDYTFTVKAEDELGNLSEQSVTWKVSPTYRNVISNFNVNEYQKVDILFVIDNSGSMAYEQQSMAQRVRNFLQIINGLDWQIGVTTTDARTSPAGGDGKLLPMTGLANTFILKSSMNENTSQVVLGNTLQRPETGSGSEQGIRATYRAIERFKSPSSNPNHAALFREGSHFATIVISDEDESDNTDKNDPNKLVSLVNTTFSGQKNFSFHSIITKPGDQACRQTHGAAYGDRYQTMSQLTSGVIGSVCATDYAAQVEDIADSVRSLLKTLPLTCTPLPGTTPVVKRNGVAYPGAFTVDSLKLLFNDVLPGGDYAIEYKCLL